MFCSDKLLAECQKRSRYVNIRFLTHVANKINRKTVKSYGITSKTYHITNLSIFIRLVGVRSSIEAALVLATGLLMGVVSLEYASRHDRILARLGLGAHHFAVNLFTGGAENSCFFG